MKTSTARKHHKCTLCERKIEKGSEYVYRRITPWDHSDNEHFSSFYGHIKCYLFWQEIGDEYDWLFPLDGHQFLEEMERHDR